MARWPTGVSVVTTRDGERDFGLTVNAFLSVSIAPPSVLVSLGHEADSTEIVARSGRFAVSLLAHDQRALSERFARTGPPEAKFQGVPVHRSTSGMALLDGAVATFDAAVVKSLDTGDHTLFVGAVERMETGPEVAPLVFFRGQYAEPTGADLLKLPRSKG